MHVFIQTNRVSDIYMYTFLLESHAYICVLSCIFVSLVTANVCLVYSTACAREDVIQ